MYYIDNPDYLNNQPSLIRLKKDSIIVQLSN